MGYMCDKCGNQDSFRQSVTETVYKEIDLELNHDGEIVDEDVVDETEDGRDEDEVTCSECQSSNVTWYDNLDEIDNERLKHTDKDGDWTEDEIEEEDWNEDLKNEIFNKRL